MIQRKIKLPPRGEDDRFMRVYDHDDRFPLTPRSRDEIVMATKELLYWAEFLAACDKASLMAAADDIDQDIIHVREGVIRVSAAIGLPIDDELTTPGTGIPIKKADDDCRSALES
jgi:hypothetical protein